MRLIIPLIVLNVLCSSSSFASQAITINPDKRIKAVISYDSMNRLAIANDRITQVIGDSEAYEVQTEETTGQIFIKPTLENGKKPLSITLITENGLTQDMTLEPVERDAATIILKNTGAGSANDVTGRAPIHPSYPQMIGQGGRQRFGQGYGQEFAAGPQMPGFGTGPEIQDQVIVAMKYLVSGSAPTIGIENFNRKSPKGLEIGLIEAFNLGNFKGYKLDVKNAGDVPMDILEKDFLQNGDLAFSFERRVLNPKTSTVLYVVTRG